MTGMRALAWCVLLGGCGLGQPAFQVKPGDNVRLDQGVNGDVGCDTGTLYLPSSSLINGALDGTDCIFKIEGTVNGPITAHGGVVHVLDVPTVNGPLAVSNALEVYVVGTGFNGELDVEDSHNVTIQASRFNGDGTVTGNDNVILEGTSFNGSLTVRSNATCVAANNSTNGGLSESCGRP